MIYTLDEITPYLSDPVPPPLPTVYLPTVGRPGDDFNSAHNAGEVLSWLGFTREHADAQGEHWTRPGKSTRDGPSATVYVDGGVAIWSSSCLTMWPALELSRSYDPFGLLVVTKFGGDFEAASADLRASGYGKPTFLEESSALVEEVEAYIAMQTPTSTATGWEPIDLALAAKIGPPPPPDICYRSDGVALFSRGKISSCYGPPECLAAETFINYCIRTSDGRRQNQKGGSIERLYKRFHGLRRSGLGSYQRPQTVDSEYWVQSVDDRGRIFHNRIINVIDSGIKEVFELKTDAGHCLEATAEHRFWVGDGFRLLSELQPGDKVYVNPGKPKFAGGRKQVSRKTVNVKYHPRGRRQNDDSLENLKLLTATEHDYEHIQESQERIAIFVEPETIASIVKVGMKQCYDISVEGPHHNFVANGIVVHNSAKSWLLQYACAEVFRNGGSFLYKDFENTAPDIAEHFRLLGITPEEMSLDVGRAVYMNPARGFTPEAEDVWRRVINQRKFDLIVIDGMSGAMSMLGKTLESNSDFVSFEMSFLRPLAATGAAVVTIDHVSKSAMPGSGPFGAQHKKAATTGCMIRFWAMEKPGRNKKGRIRLFLEKDKTGYLGQHVYDADEEETRRNGIADFFLTPYDNRLLAELHPVATSPRYRPSQVMERLSRYLEHHPNCDELELLSAPRKDLYHPFAVPIAFRCLLEEGHVKFGPGGTVRLVQPFRLDDESVPTLDD